MVEICSRLLRWGKRNHLWKIESLLRASHWGLCAQLFRACSFFFPRSFPKHNKKPKPSTAEKNSFCSLFLLLFSSLSFFIFFSPLSLRLSPPFVLSTTAEY